MCPPKHVTGNNFIQHKALQLLKYGQTLPDKIQHRWLWYIMTHSGYNHVTLSLSCKTQLNSFFLPVTQWLPVKVFYITTKILESKSLKWTNRWTVSSCRWPPSQLGCCPSHTPQSCRPLVPWLCRGIAAASSLGTTNTTHQFIWPCAMYHWQSQSGGTNRSPQGAQL